MKLNDIDLNLLVVLNVILEEKNLTKAAKKLCITQSAVSHTLKTLRKILDDELIFRGPFNRLLLTKKAIDLKIPLKRVLSELSEILIDTSKFDPQHNKTCYSVGMTDNLASILLDPLSKKLTDFTDTIRISVNDINDLTSYDDFISHDLDIAIGNYSVSSQNILSEELFKTNLVCVGDKNHAAFKEKNFTFDTLLKYPQFQIRYRKDINDLNSRVIEEHSHKYRKIVIAFSNQIVALLSLKDSDYLCLAHEYVVEKYKDMFGLDFRRLPFPEVKANLYWKKEDDKNSSIVWLRKLIKESL